MKKINYLLIVLTLIVASLASCKKDDEAKPQPKGTVTAKAGNAQNVTVGQSVTLDGSASTDSDNKPLTYSWATTKKPNGSTISLTNPTQAKPTFIADLAGEYEFELTVSSDNGQSKAKTIVTAAGSATGIILSENITADRILTNIVSDPTKPDYIVTADIEVSAKLTVNPGVVIQFDACKGMYIDNNPMGAIIAKGTVAEPISFTGKEKVKGYWKGIMIYSSNPLNEMDFVEVSYGGCSPLAGINVKSNLVVYGNATPGGSLKVTNSTFSNSGGYGLYIEDGTAELKGFANNTVTANTGIAMYIEADQVHMLDAASKFNDSNLGFNGVEIDGSTKKDSPEVTWPAFADGSKYLVTHDLEFNSGVRIAAGANFVFEADRALYVKDNGGYIIAKGIDASKKITFTGKHMGSGFWKGIMIYSSSPLNEFDYVEVAHAGKSALTGVNIKASVVIYGNATPGGLLTVTNSTFMLSGGYGLYVEDGTARLGSFVNNTFNSNAGPAAVFVDADQVHKLDAASKFENSNGLGVEISGLVKELNEVTWPALAIGAKYYVTDDLEFESGVKIAPGANFEFAAGKALYISNNGGYMIAKGTATQKIIFTGATKTTGYWKGIMIYSSSTLNEVDHAEISYGGSTNLTGVSIKANLVLYDNATPAAALKITNSVIKNSGGYGIVAITSEGVTINPDFETANTFTSNTISNVLKTN